MNERRRDISICVLIGLAFLWTGCGYLSWLYHLTGFYSSASVDMLTEVVGYLFQAAGLLALSLYKKNNPGKPDGKYSFALISAAGLVLCLLASLSPTGAVSLIFGYGMNTVFGLIAGSYLFILSEHASSRHIGLIFGVGYGLGSIASFLISLIGEDNFLADRRAFIVYLVIFAVTVPLSASIVTGSRQAYSEPDCGDMLSFIIIPGITILLLSCVKSGGFYFPAADLGDHNVSLELSRSFYAAGLVAAGLINDRKRSAGAVLCVAALVFPFFSMAAGSHTGINYLLWIFGYIFFGFYSVYRVILFTDLSRKERGMSYIACLGLMWGRLGDASGSAIGITLSEKPVVLISLMALLFVICIFLFFYHYQALYMQPADGTTDYVIQFSARYDLSQRETDLLRLILISKTNKEIAEDLYISENTVKFHVRNLLRKTGCSNKKELLSLFDNFRSPQ